MLYVGLCDARVCCDSWSDWICPSPSANLWLCHWQKLPTPWQNLLHALWLMWYRGVQLFHQLFAVHRSLYLTQRFWTLICQPKGLYSKALLFCIHVTWHSFASSTVAFLTAVQPYRPVSPSLLLIVEVDTFFSWHWFSCAVMFTATNLLSSKLVTLMWLYSTLVVAFGLPALLLVLFCPAFWCFQTV